MTQLEDGSIEIAGVVYPRHSSAWSAYQLGVATHIIETLLGDEKETRKYLPKGYDKKRAREFLKILAGDEKK